MPECSRVHPDGSTESVARDRERSDERIELFGGLLKVGLMGAYMRDAQVVARHVLANDSQVADREASGASP
jgi:hypothetical protein